MDGVPIERIGPYGERSASGKWRMLPVGLPMARAQRKAAYDVVCCVDYRGVGVAAIAARAVTGRPVVLQAQTPGDLLDLALLARPVIAVYRRADAFACISHGLEREAHGRRRAGRAGALSARTPSTSRGSGLPRRTSGSALAERAGLPPGAVVCLFVGRLSREKGVMDLMDGVDSAAAGERRAPGGRART